MAKYELSPAQKKLQKLATQIQREGGTKIVTQTRYKIDRGTAIKKAAAAINYQKPKKKK